MHLTVTCIENKKLQTTADFDVLHSNISWKCTRHSVHIYLTCKGSERRNRTLRANRMCCEVSIQRKNNTLTTRPGIPSYSTAATKPWSWFTFALDNLSNHCWLFHLYVFYTFLVLFRDYYFFNLDYFLPVARNFF